MLPASILAGRHHHFLFFLPNSTSTRLTADKTEQSRSTQCSLHTVHISKTQKHFYAHYHALTVCYDTETATASKHTATTSACTNSFTITVHFPTALWPTQVFQCLALQENSVQDHLISSKCNHKAV